MTQEKIKIVCVDKMAYEDVLRNSIKVNDLEAKNQQLKELLLQIRNRQSLIREYLSDCKLGNAWDLLYQTENEIDNAIGELKSSEKNNKNVKK